MKCFRGLLFFIIIHTAVSSCQKEISNNNNIVPVITGDSLYLDKLYFVEYGDTIETTTLTYDALKRVVSMISAFPAGSYTHERSYRYFYNGIDTIPYKSNYLYADDDTRDTSVTYHYYDGSLKNLTDSVISSHYSVPVGFFEQLNKVVHYSYDAGKKYAYTTLEYPLSPTNNSSRMDTAIIDGNNNITLNKGYFPSFPGPGYEQHTNSTLSYDNHVNPFSLLSNFKAHQLYPSGETLFYEYFSYNNILNQTETMTGYPLRTIANNYQYKTNGLPSSVHIVFNSTDSSDIYFTYKKL